ncbi:hypothetical protein BBP40_000136 [Aspergillus hancockii]|nr:hypothetical protein BBP40_000136 [Aspergillus hancockii]
MVKIVVDQTSFAIEDGNHTTVSELSKIQRWKAHIKKWWWLYLVGLCCVVLVTALPIVYVGVPRFASDRINNYDFDFGGLAITDPTPTSFHVRQSQKFHAGMGTSGRLSEFNATMSNSDSDKSFANFPFPGIQFGDDARFNIDQSLELSCVSCFSQLAEEAVRSEEVDVQVTGSPDLEVKALPTTRLSIQKTVKLPGLNVQEFMSREDAFNVTKLDIIDPRTNKGYNVNASIAFNSPTAISIEMGTASLNLTVGDSTLGYVDIPNLTLRNGTSNAVVLGNLDENLLIQKGLWESNNSDYGKVTIGIHGTRCEFNGQEIPYFTAAVRAISASTTINLFDYIPDIL